MENWSDFHPRNKGAAGKNTDFNHYRYDDTLQGWLTELRVIFIQKILRAKEQSCARGATLFGELLE